MWHIYLYVYKFHNVREVYVSSVQDSVHGHWVWFILGLTWYTIGFMLVYMIWNKFVGECTSPIVFFRDRTECLNPSFQFQRCSWRKWSPEWVWVKAYISPIFGVMNIHLPAISGVYQWRVFTHSTDVSRLETVALRTLGKLEPLRNPLT